MVHEIKSYLYIYESHKKKGEREKGKIL